MNLHVDDAGIHHRHGQMRSSNGHQSIRARVYATGMSNGAMMALRLGCQTNTFAAIAPVAGTLMTDCSHAQPTSVLQIHGTADDRVPYNGGPGKTQHHHGQTDRRRSFGAVGQRDLARHRRVRSADVDHLRGT